MLIRASERVANCSVVIANKMPRICGFKCDDSRDDVLLNSRHVVRCVQKGIKTKTKKKLRYIPPQECNLPTSQPPIPSVGPRHAPGVAPTRVVCASVIGQHLRQLYSDK